MSRSIKMEYMARVEGEASVFLEVEGREVKELVLDIFEPPRFFQGFLVGRKYDEVPDIVARICGICPVAHEVTAIQALEAAMDIQVSSQVRDLRHLLALAQSIQSHTLHIYLLALPDYLGYESAVAMAADHGPAVQRALRLKKLANEFTALIGGRDVHPVTAVVGGFTRIPGRDELKAMAARLEQVREDIEATVDLVKSLPLPDFERPNAEHVALRNGSGYAMNDGQLVSNRGLDLAPGEYRQAIRERHVPPSHALFSSVAGRDSFLVGPLARLNLNLDRLSPRAKAALRRLEHSFPSTNPFASILARAVELVQYLDDALAIIDRYEGHPDPIVRRVQAGSGAAFTEAPRGTLYHAYTVDRNGIVQSADIVSPTAHNAYNMQNDLCAFAPSVLDRTDEEIALALEMLVRSYDPCFSCSAHFMKLNLTRH